MVAEQAPVHFLRPALRNAVKLPIKNAMLAAIAIGLISDGGVAKAACPPTPHERQILVKMYDFAGHHKSVPLLDMQRTVESSADPLLADNYRVALYIANGTRFKRQFVDDFPTDMRGFIDLGCGRTFLDLNPPVFPYDMLDNVAMTGDKTAIRKALLVETDGAVAEQTTDAATHIAARYPHTALAQLKDTTPAQRDRVMCFNLDDYYRKAEFEHFLATKPASAGEAALLKDLNLIVRHCTTLRPSVSGTP